MSLRSPLLVSTCLVSLLACSSAFAAEKRLAILEVEGTAATPEERMYITDRLRAEALKHYPPSKGWTVMDRGNMAALVEANLADCEGECAVETFENISADIGVTARLVKIGGSLRLALSLYDVHKKGLMGTEEAKAASLEALLEQLPRASARLLGPERFAFEKDPALPPRYQEFSRSCQGGNLQSCARLGRAYRRGVGGVSKDRERAAAIYRYACKNGFLAACGAMASFGLGAPKDQRRAVEIYTQSCAAREIMGCNNLGFKYAKGKGVAKDERRAVQLYRQACTGGSILGCANLGGMYEKGKGIDRSPAKAVPLYRKACEGGHKWSCKRLRKLGH